MLVSLNMTVLALGAAMAGANAEPRPLHLQVEERGDLTIVSVVGFSNDRVTIPYALEVSQRGNRSVQRGVANLPAGQRATLASVRLTGKAALAAELTVGSGGSSDYREQASLPGR